MEKKMNVYETPMTEILELEVEQAMLNSSLGEGYNNNNYDNI